MIWFLTIYFIRLKINQSFCFMILLFILFNLGNLFYGRLIKFCLLNICFCWFLEVHVRFPAFPLVITLTRLFGLVLSFSSWSWCTLKQTHHPLRLLVLYFLGPYASLFLKHFLKSLHGIVLYLHLKLSAIKMALLLHHGLFKCHSLLLWCLRFREWFQKLLVRS